LRAPNSKNNLTLTSNDKKSSHQRVVSTDYVITEGMDTVSELGGNFHFRDSGVNMEENEEEPKYHNLTKESLHIFNSNFIGKASTQGSLSYLLINGSKCDTSTSYC
jgi:hypothetical protein